METDTEQLARIERDRRKRERDLLTLLLLYTDKSLSQARAAIRTGGNPIQAAQQTIQGTAANVSHVHWQPLQSKLLQVLAEVFAAGYSRAAAMAEVSADVLPIGPSVRQAANELADKTGQAVARVTAQTISAAEQNGLNASKAARLLGETFRAAGLSGDDPFALDAAAERAVVTNYGGGMFELWETKAVDKVTGFRHVSTLDDRTTPICRERDGLMKSASDPYWRSNWPSLHWRCRSVVLPIFGKFTPTAGYPITPPMEGFGQAPFVAYGSPVGY